MKKHFAFASAAVIFHLVSFYLIVSRLGATEHARMFNEYVPTTYDRILGVGGFIFFYVPSSLLDWMLPKEIARNIFLPWSFFFTFMVALLLSILFHKWKSRKYDARD